MNEPCTKPKQPAADDLVSDCERLSGGVKRPSVFKKSLEVNAYSSDYWEDEVTNLFIYEDTGLAIELL